MADFPDYAAGLLRPLLFYYPLSEGVPKMEYPKGIDVSHHQGLVDWREVSRAGIEFTFIKATEGVHFADPAYGRNHGGAKVAGLLRGPYLYLRGAQDPKKQVEHFLHVVGSWELGDLQPAIDVEADNNGNVPKEQMFNTLWDVAHELEKQSGQNPIIYSYNDYWRTVLKNTPVFAARYPLWIAHYDVKKPRLFGDWSLWSFWQYSSTGHVPGVQGSCDLNYFNGTSGQLRKFAGY